MAQVHLLSGGAAQGLLTHLDGQLQAAHALQVAGTFGAVGIMKDSLLAGTACDVVLLTEGLISQLAASGHVVPGSARALGVVKTGVAVKTGAPAPAVDSPAALKAALQAARGIYIPDPVKSTAGIHFMNVLRQLGLETEVANALRPFPNGMTAMKAMADCSESGLIGCTQVTEIMFTPGVHLIAALPREFELATVYTAAVCSKAAQPDAARTLISVLAHADAAATRQACGFE